jgi:hypothetical protein
MTTQSLTVAEAQRLLDDARTTEQRQRHKLLTDRLCLVRAELAEKRPAFEKLKLDIMQAQADLTALRKNLVTISETIGKSANLRPRIADFLPNDDPEVQQWQTRHRALEREQARLLAQRSTTANVELMRMDALKLAETIKSLEFEAENILRELEGSFGLQPGGVLGVV